RAPAGARAGFPPPLPPGLSCPDRPPGRASAPPPRQARAVPCAARRSPRRSATAPNTPSRCARRTGRPADRPPTSGRPARHAGGPPAPACRPDSRVRLLGVSVQLAAGRVAFEREEPPQQRLGLRRASGLGQPAQGFGGLVQQA